MICCLQLHINACNQIIFWHLSEPSAIQMNSLWLTLKLISCGTNGSLYASAYRFPIAQMKCIVWRGIPVEINAMAKIMLAIEFGNIIKDQMILVVTRSQLSVCSRWMIRCLKNGQNIKKTYARAIVYMLSVPPSIPSYCKNGWRHVGDTQLVSASPSSSGFDYCLLALIDRALIKQALVRMKMWNKSGSTSK